MKKITKSDLIKAVPERWFKIYCKKNDWSQYGGKDKELIYINLMAEKELTEEKIFKIIGNKSWTANYCDECNSDKDVLIQLGQEPDYESRTAFICIDCLNKAINL